MLTRLKKWFILRFPSFFSIHNKLKKLLAYDAIVKYPNVPIVFLIGSFRHYLLLFYSKSRQEFDGFYLFIFTFL